MSAIRMLVIDEADQLIENNFKEETIMIKRLLTIRLPWPRVVWSTSLSLICEWIEMVQGIEFERTNIIIFSHIPG